MGPASMRREHWELALHDAVISAQHKPFAYGTHDCATWAFDVRRHLTGIDTASTWRGKYATEQGAGKWLRKLGCQTVRDLANKYLGTPLSHVRLAQRGDIVLADDALGVCLGRKVALVGDDGLVQVSLRNCRAAWRVA